MKYRKSAIPPRAKLVFSGEIFDVYQWEQEMFDGSTGTFEMLKRADTVTVIAVTKDKKILVQEQTQPSRPSFLSLPGGRIDANESPLSAAKRELMEESGYQSDDWELYTTVAPFHKIDWVLYTYIARGCVKTQSQKLDAGEKIQNIVVDFDEFITLCEKPENRNSDVSNHIMSLRVYPDKLVSFRKLLGV